MKFCKSLATFIFHHKKIQEIHDVELWMKSQVVLNEKIIRTY